MNLGRLSFVLLGGAAVPALVMIACEDNSEPDCRDEACIVILPDTGVPDTAPLPQNDATVPPPDPFDAGVNVPPPCKGLFELCSTQECCSPYGCTNGTCR